ncbi:MAG: MotA/TolQ/ExbB proton channel [Novosphingobium lindaniclasticum]|jgi:biopolymer transport protein ExbB|uniref:Biopolymer transport protein ExbB n=1 Tax=Novosphingobium lindaniclasticum LE124 TaxID=1096930 RepID=T0J2Y5_9SPHN|nr:MotA/TolQ/ExbB proton channel family protein [Novosphingobium lindaniclasticum]EQB18495.1 flagellar motor protein MotA [Novosphingobium lindaniclasticum LE124]MDF2637599.1 MotA/TolQ/ExbB proton channel [Novosphingobium lindaniclasticum]
MLIDILAAAGEAAPQNKFGFMEALEAGGFISYATVIIMGIMSFGSFYILFTKWFEQSKIMRQYNVVRTTFWKAPTLREGAAKLEKNSAWRQLVDDGIAAEDQHAKMTDSLEAHDWMHASLARSEASINARLAQGLPFLATVGATAPFIGLFGTVVGIYRALIAIGIAGSASIDKVAGPVGESLIMTALGLIVAVPAVLAYNYLQSRNKRIAENLTGFSSDVLANINSKGAVKPIVVAAPAKTAAAPAKPAAAPAKP